MLCVPTERLLVLKLAWCVDALTVPVPRVVVPSLKVTVPVGLPPKAVVMVAVKATVWPLFDGFGVDVSAVAVLAWFTFWLTTGDVLGVKSTSPPYTAVSEWVPTLSVETDKLPMPLVLSVAVPKTFVPSLNVTLPVGMPLVEDFA